MHNEFTVPHEVWESAEFKALTPSAKVLYTTLCKIRNRPGRKKDWFFRSEIRLADDAGLKIRTVQRAKRELLATGLIETKRGHYQDHGWRGADFYHIKAYENRQSVKNVV